MTKRRRSEDPVTLTKTPYGWGTLPPAMKRAIHAGVDRVRRIRIDITEKALVSVMPPIRVCDAAWTTPACDCVIHGRTTPLQIGGAWQLGVELPAPTIVYAEDTALRGVLLHEFSHCFNAARRFVAILEGGSTFDDRAPDRTVFDDEDHDRRRLEAPEVWFGAEDAANIPCWHSCLLDQCTRRTATEWVARDLPVVVPPTEWAAPSLEILRQFEIPLQWIERIQRSTW